MRQLSARSFYVALLFYLPSLCVSWAADSIFQPGSVDAFRTAASRGGDAVAGARLFASAAQVCAICHSFDGRGGKLGPDLLGVADKFDRNGLIRAVRDSSPFSARHQSSGLSHSHLCGVKNVDAAELLS
jgi:hypothetical protein